MTTWHVMWLCIYIYRTPSLPLPLFSLSFSLFLWKTASVVLCFSPDFKCLRSLYLSRFVVRSSKSLYFFFVSLFFRASYHCFLAWDFVFSKCLLLVAVIPWFSMLMVVCLQVPFCSLLFLIWVVLILGFLWAWVCFLSFWFLGFGGVFLAAYMYICVYVSVLILDLI